jgi:hypothetical protein
VGDSNWVAVAVFFMYMFPAFVHRYLKSFSVFFFLGSIIFDFFLVLIHSRIPVHLGMVYVIHRVFSGSVNHLVPGFPVLESYDYYFDSLNWLVLYGQLL